jgi:hypothetical protein
VSDRVDTLRGRDSVFGFPRSYDIFIGPDAVDPVNVGNGVVEYRHPGVQGARTTEGES